MNDNTITNADIQNHYFREILNETGFWQCIACTKKYKRCNGYTNLVNHVKAVHKAYVTEILAARAQPNAGLMNHHLIINDSAQNMFDWLDLIIGLDFPFSLCESAAFRKVLKLKPVSRKTLKKYMRMLAARVKVVIEQEFPGGGGEPGLRAAGAPAQ